MTSGSVTEKINGKLGEYVKIVVQVAVIIWGASTIVSRVGNLEVTIVENKLAINTIQAEIKALEIDHAKMAVVLQHLEDARK
jgi:hypothetical protein